MNASLPEQNFNPDIQQKLAEKISALYVVEKDFPGAIIVHNLSNSHVVYMSQWGCNYLNTTTEELQQMGTDYHNIYFNPEDVNDFKPKIFALMESKDYDSMVTYFQQVRQSPKHEWYWFLTSTKIFLRDEKNNPAFIISTAIPVDKDHYIINKVQRLLEETNFLKENNHIFNQLTNREKEILRMAALGSSSSEIAKALNISEMTATTHRRNIKKKLKAENNYDLVKFAQAFNLL